MKKILKSILLIITCTFLFGSTVAFADVIFEPMGDDFYTEHSSEMVYKDRMYYINGPDGHADLYESPENLSVVKTLDNGDRYYVSHTYTDKKGHTFGIIDAYTDGESVTGWVPMEYLFEAYSADLFFAQYGDYIKAESVETDISELDEFYAYLVPGSSTYYTLYADYEDFLYSSFVFTDAAGRRWGYISYYYGNSDLFFCIDDPGKDPAELMADGFSNYDTRLGGSYEAAVPGPVNSGTEEAEETTPALPEPEVLDYIEDKQNLRGVTIIVTAVIVFVTGLVSAVILLLIRSKMKKNKQK